MWEHPKNTQQNKVLAVYLLLAHLPWNAFRALYCIAFLSTNHRAILRICHTFYMLGMWYLNLPAYDTNLSFSANHIATERQSSRGSESESLIVSILLSLRLARTASEGNLTCGTRRQHFSFAWNMICEGHLPFKPVNRSSPAFYILLRLLRFLWDII